MTASVDETKREWLTFQIRDRAGGRDEAWMVPDELLVAARRLEGFVDIATESSRSTTCSMHLPTGTLQGWLRRNSDRRFVYAIDCREGRWLGERDRSIQSELSELGSIHRLNDSTYLLASKNDWPISKVGRDSMDWMVRSLGSMDDFVQRLDRATRLDASHGKPKEAALPVEALCEEDARTSRQVFKEPKLIQPLRPRRVKI